MTNHDDLQAVAESYTRLQSQRAVAAELGVTRKWVRTRLRRAAEQGLLGTKPVLPGFRISQTTSTPKGDYVQQRPEFGPEFVPTDGLTVKGKTTLVSGDGRIMHQHVMERADAQAQAAAMRAAVEGFKDEIPQAAPSTFPAGTFTSSDLLNLYVLTDVHMGALAWAEETGDADYDLRISERLVDDWFAAAISLAPPARVGVLAQLGDLLHYDSFESVTPKHRHVLDGDSRFDKMVRVAIRVLRKIVKRMLDKHERVIIVMADANHDPTSESWLRGWMAAHYDEEPRVTVDDSPGTYYAHKHGQVSLFLHHGHRRGVNNVDSVFAGRYREIYGSTKFSYAHLGHKHSDELKTTNLMKVEQHETLAAPDAYAANSGWLSGRSAKVITYHAAHGEVARFTLTPGMVMGAAAANDNQPKTEEKAA